MIRKIMILTIFMGLCLDLGFGMVTFEADNDHSFISFSVRHMMISQVKGQFKDYSVVISANPDNIVQSSVVAVIKTASIDTGIDKRDEDLRGPKYFDVAKYPEMVFKSTRIEKEGSYYIAHGTLTLHGVTKTIALPFKITGQTEFPKGKKRVGIDANYTLNRKDYGIIWDPVLDKGGTMVGDEIKVEILLEVVEK
ncbi:MAG: YceI family protein [Candidatus Omnitrophota bacterium]